MKGTFASVRPAIGPSSSTNAIPRRATQAQMAQLHGHQA